MEPRPKVNVLLVDDQPSNLLALEAILAGEGLNLVRAPTGEQALMRVLDDDYAAILMDVQMPGMDGFETAELIRQRDRSKHTPILFLTAFQSTEAQIQRGYALGAVDFLSKPIVADGAPVQGRGLRRAVPEERAGQAAGGPPRREPAPGARAGAGRGEEAGGRWSGSARRPPGRSGSPRSWHGRPRS